MPVLSRNERSIQKNTNILWMEFFSACLTVIKLIFNLNAHELKRFSLLNSFNDAEEHLKQLNSQLAAAGRGQYSAEGLTLNPKVSQQLTRIEKEITVANQHRRELKQQISEQEAYIRELRLHIIRLQNNYECSESLSPKNGSPNPRAYSHGRC